MMKIFRFIKRIFSSELKIDKDGIATDRYGRKWVPLSKLYSLDDYCDFQITLKHGHIENVIEILKESDGTDDLKGNLIRLLESHGYKI
jgi:hypothetical protein